nr:hypothetical protein 23 [Spirochaetaceae bacterium]
MTREFVCTWTSGYEDRRPLYLREDDRGWGATENRELATRYRSKTAAIQAWLGKHAFPGDYVKHIEAGAVRAEAVDQLEMCL